MADAASIRDLPTAGTRPVGVARPAESADEVPKPPLAAAPAPAASHPQAPVASPPPAAAPAAARDASPRSARRGGSLVSAIFALLSLAGAAVALTAPTLRPQAFELARSWLGEGSPVLRYLAPPAAAPEQPELAPLTYPTPAFQAPVSVAGDTSLQAAALAAVRAELIATLRLELDGLRRASTEQGARLATMGAAFQAAKSDMASARGDARTAADAAARAEATAGHAQDMASRALAAATERVDRVEAQVAAFDARVRATGLVVAAGQLRRDIDAGAPLHDDIAALTASGPAPVPVQQALELLSRAEAGVPTLRALGVGFEGVDSAIAAHTGGAASWFTLSGWFGGAGTARDTMDRMRALAADGRFSEVADTLERTEWADLAQRWASQVRQRSTAVIAGQTVMAHALAAYEASQTTPPTWPQIIPATGPARASP